MTVKGARARGERGSTTVEFVVLVPLAATSNAPMIRRLGARWRKLHRLAYLAAAAAALHFIMLVKVWPLEPLTYAALVAALLLFRLAYAFRPRARGSRAQKRTGRTPQHSRAPLA